MLNNQVVVITGGAGSIVTKDIPDGTVYAGNPAKLITHE
jgi:acetyltransferase-like isoleucine patch superfamily enzyme